MLLDQLERFGVDDRREHDVERLAYEFLDVLLIPALRQREHRFAHAFHLVVVGADEQIDDLRVEPAHDRALRDETVAIERAAQRHHGTRRDHRLVEIEERGLHEREAYVAAVVRP